MNVSREGVNPAMHTTACDNFHVMIAQIHFKEGMAPQRMTQMDMVTCFRQAGTHERRRHLDTVRRDPHRND